MLSLFRIICAFLIFLLSSFSPTIAGTEKPEVYEEAGNIFLKHDSNITKLTDINKDSEPVLSPNGRWVVFNRKVKECSEEDNIWVCPSHQLWIVDLETQSTRMLLEPQNSPEPENQIDKFHEKTFSPDSNILYFSTPTYATASAIHSVRTDGTNLRFITAGFDFHIVQKPLGLQTKKYIKTLKNDDWRISPKNIGMELIQKTLNDEIIGYLILEKSGIKTICSSKPVKGPQKYRDGKKYCATFGRSIWKALVSPDGSQKIPISREDY
jgi:hypothetical protein